VVFYSRIECVYIFGRPGDYHPYLYPVFSTGCLAVSRAQDSLSLLNILISLPLASLMIAIIIGGFEYQHRFMGKPGAWRLLARTLAFETGILLLALFL
jgi:hypothetical protein